MNTFSIIPLHGIKDGKCTCGNPNCDRPGKHPCIPNWKEYQTRRPTPEELAGWKKKFPNSNWAIITGQVVGIVVLDVDGPEGAEAVKGKHLPLTWAVSTGKGTHYYFLHPGFPVGNGVRVLPGVDIRGDGGYAVAPGSVHVSGKKYEWVPGLSPADIPDGPAPCPKWLLDLLQKRQAPAGGNGKLDPVQVLAGVPEGQRDVTLFRYACRLRAQGLTREEATRLVLEAAKNCQPPFPEREALQKVEQAFKYPEGQKPLVEGFSAAELVQSNFPDPNWFVEGILPEGLTILGGPPKTGKSWLCLGLAVAVGSGGVALGKIPVDKKAVIYLALEDNPRRLKSRLVSVLQGSPAPENLHFYTTWPALDKGGLEMLEQAILRHDAGLVIIDTLAKVRHKRRANVGIYEDDYQALSGLKNLADRYGVAVLVVTHVKKGQEEDPINLISGSTGLTGCADGILVLSRKRCQADAVLFATGRDYPEEQELALVFDQATTSWHIAGSAQEYRLTKERREILKAIQELGSAARPKEIAELINKNHSTVRVLLRKLEAEGVVNSVGGAYCISSVYGKPVNSINSINSVNTVNSITRFTVYGSINRA
jgi:DNA-binding CsgD family transcriptional regulator